MEQTPIITREDITSRLFALRDVEYREFQCKLMPTVDRETVIGVRTPALRALAKEIGKSPALDVFLAELPHRYYEENNLHGYLISAMKSPSECLAALDRFLPFVNNWATCDGISPKCLLKDQPAYLAWIRSRLSSKDTYVVRFAIEMLMADFLDARFSPEYLDWVAGVTSEEYYINMMSAWYFATALTKQYDAALPYLCERKLSPWVHQKTIQKAIESYRIAPDLKDYLRKLK